jgi:peptide deformylase
MILDILQHPDPRLAQVCEDAKFDDGTELVQRDDFDPPQAVGPMKALLTDMVHTMMNMGPALGLAAPQVGHNVRAICVFEKRSGTVHAMLNPRIISRGTMRTNDPEGCLSVNRGQTAVRVHRRHTVVVEGHRPNGAKFRVGAKGQLAVALQHEIDHLNGITIADRTPPRTKRPLHAGASS